MLQSLHIMNFAIIEDTWIELGPGANMFTGETGSGKSILMDALAILLGRRASVELIRNGKDFSEWKVSFLWNLHCFLFWKRWAWIQRKAPLLFPEK